MSIVTVDATSGFAAAFLAGVALAVYVLVRGVERRGRKSVAALPDDFGRETGIGRIALGTPIAASSLIILGAVGYTGVRVGSLSSGIAVLLAMLAVAISAPVVTRLVRRWARRAAIEDAPDPRFALQGLIGRIRRAGTPNDTAEVEYAVNGRLIVAAARSLDHHPLLPGIEVVIDRVEGGIVYVEPWSRVEQRL